MVKKREPNYDLLRVTAMLAVIVIHVSEFWISGLPIYRAETGMVIDQMQTIAACIFKALSGFAVPCFVMLSGAFHLADERNSNTGYYYRKTFQKIGIHTLVFSVLYFLYRSIFCFVGEKVGKDEFLIVLFDLVTGEPMGHMGYLYRMAWIYLLTPLLLRVKNRTSDRIIPLLSVLCFLLVGIPALWSTESRLLLKLDIAQTVEYMGYFLLGYVIRKYVPRKRTMGVVCVTMGFLSEVWFGINQYSEIFLGMEAEIPKILSVLAMVLIFTGFTMISVPESKWISRLRGLSFIIYLVHQVVIDVLSKVLYHVIGPYYYAEMNCFIWIPVLTLMVLLISIALRDVYNWASYRFLCYG